jgi:hypothetical protein
LPEDKQKYFVSELDQLCSKLQAVCVDEALPVTVKQVSAQETRYWDRQESHMYTRALFKGRKSYSLKKISVTQSALVSRRAAAVRSAVLEEGDKVLKLDSDGEVTMGVLPTVRPSGRPRKQERTGVRFGGNWGRTKASGALKPGKYYDQQHVGVPVAAVGGSKQKQKKKGAGRRKAA